MSATKNLLLAPLTLGLISSTYAAVIVTPMASDPSDDANSDEITFAGDVSTTDLLNGLTPTTSGWQTSLGSVAGLNDGLPGGDFNADGIGAVNGKAWMTNGSATAEFLLDLSSAPLGYDITDIQTISSWSGAGFMHQVYSVSFRTVGSPTFNSIGSVDFQPFDGTSQEDGGSTKVNFTDSSGIIASGVDAIRFDFVDPSDSFTNGGSIIAEIDAFGTPTQIPEPSSIALFALAGLSLLRRRR